MLTSTDIFYNYKNSLLLNVQKYGLIIIKHCI